MSLSFFPYACRKGWSCHKRWGAATVLHQVQPAGKTEFLLILPGSDIWITYPRNLTQLRCHSWKEWLYMLAGEEELIAWEQPRPICFLCKTHVLAHSLGVLLVTCLLPKVKIYPPSTSFELHWIMWTFWLFSKPNPQTSWLHPSLQLFLLLVPLLY